MDWKSHPVVAAVTAGAVTMAFCVTTVLPIWTKVLENKVEEYQKEIDTLKGISQALEVKAEYFERRNKTLIWSEILGSNIPYPKGFNGVKIGAPTSEIEESFKGANIELKKDKWVSVEMLGSSEVIREATYYFDAKSNVSHILYFFSDLDEKMSSLEDNDGKLGATGNAILTNLKSAYPSSKMSCNSDDGYLDCQLFAPNYRFEVNSKSYHILPNK